MSFHKTNSNEFLGLRSFIGGRRQIVYDAYAGKRVILDISDVSATDEDINKALQEGIKERNVLGGVLSALKVRKIGVDFSF